MKEKQSLCSSAENLLEERRKNVFHSQVLSNMKSQSSERTLRIPANKIAFRQTGPAFLHRNNLSKPVYKPFDQKPFAQSKTIAANISGGKLSLVKLQKLTNCHRIAN